MPETKRYRECVAEIVAVLRKYDMGGAITVVDKERAMFKYVFPSWSCIKIEGNKLRIKSQLSDYPSLAKQEEVLTSSTHIIAQIRDIAAQTFGFFDNIYNELGKFVKIDHTAFFDFDPEHEQ